MDKMSRVVMIVCAALLFLPVLMKGRTSREIPVRTACHVFSGNRISVKVGGDVLHAGIYEVPANSLAISVINMARSVRPMKQVMIDASAGRPLENGAAITLAVRPDGAYRLLVNRMTTSEHIVLGIPLDIATLSEADFILLPGIGPAIARRIAMYRQNNGGLLRVGDLAGIEGIGEKKFSKVYPLFQHP